MSVTSYSTMVGVFGNRAVAEQAMDALANIGLEREHMHLLVPGASAGFFEELKSLFTGNEPAPADDKEELVRQLMNMGLSNAQSEYYAQAYNQGYTLLTVKAEGREQEVLGIMYQFGAAQQQVAATPASTSYSDPAYTGNAPAWAAEETEAQAAVNPQTTATPDEQTAERAAVAPVTPRYGLDMDDAPAESPDTNPAYYQQAYDETSVRPENATGNYAGAPTYTTGTSTSEQETPAYQTSSEYRGQADTSEHSEAVYSTGGQEDEVTPTYRTSEQEHNISAPEYQSAEDDNEYATSEYQTDEPEARASTPTYQTSEQEDEDVTPDYGSSEHFNQGENSVYKAPEQLNEVATPTYQTSEQANGFANATYQVGEQSDGFRSAPYPTGVDTPEQTDQAAMSTYQPDTETNTPYNKSANGFATSQAESSSHNHEMHLQQLREQVRNTQQQLQETKAQLELARKHEAEYQETHKQLQDLQAELESTSQELQQARERIAQYHR